MSGFGGGVSGDYGSIALCKDPKDLVTYVMRNQSKPALPGDGKTLWQSTPGKLVPKSAARATRARPASAALFKRQRWGAGAGTDEGGISRPSSAMSLHSSTSMSSNGSHSTHLSAHHTFSSLTKKSAGKHFNSRPKSAMGLQSSTNFFNSQRSPSNASYRPSSAHSLPITDAFGNMTGAPDSARSKASLSDGGSTFGGGSVFLPNDAANEPKLLAHRDIPGGSGRRSVRSEDDGLTGAGRSADPRLHLQEWMDKYAKDSRAFRSMSLLAQTVALELFDADDGSAEYESYAVRDGLRVMVAAAMLDRLLPDGQDVHTSSLAKIKSVLVDNIFIESKQEGGVLHQVREVLEGDELAPNLDVNAPVIHTYRELCTKLQMLVKEIESENLGLIQQVNRLQRESTHAVGEAALENAKCQGLQLTVQELRKRNDELEKLLEKEKAERVEESQGIREQLLTSQARVETLEEDIKVKESKLATSIPMTVLSVVQQGLSAWMSVAEATTETALSALSGLALLTKAPSSGGHAKQGHAFSDEHSTDQVTWVLQQALSVRASSGSMLPERTDSVSGSESESEEDQSSAPWKVVSDSLRSVPLTKALIGMGDAGKAVSKASQQTRGKAPAAACLSAAVMSTLDGECAMQLLSNASLTDVDELSGADSSQGSHLAPAGDALAQILETELNSVSVTDNGNKSAENSASESMAVGARAAAVTAWIHSLYTVKTSAVPTAAIIQQRIRELKGILTGVSTSQSSSANNSPTSRRPSTSASPMLLGGSGGSPAGLRSGGSSPVHAAGNRTASLVGRLPKVGPLSDVRKVMAPWRELVRDIASADGTERSAAIDDVSDKANHLVQLAGILRDSGPAEAEQGCFAAWSLMHSSNQGIASASQLLAKVLVEAAAMSKQPNKE